MQKLQRIEIYFKDYSENNKKYLKKGKIEYYSKHREDILIRKKTITRNPLSMTL